MPRTKLMVNKETLAELTSDEMTAVVGGADSGSCTIANVCIGKYINTTSGSQRTGEFAIACA